MELAVGITIRQLLLHLHCASEFKAPSYASTSPSDSLLGMPIYKFGNQALAGRPLSAFQPASHGSRRRECSDSGDHQAGRRVGTDCHCRDRVLAFPALLCTYTKQIL